MRRLAFCMVVALACAAGIRADEVWMANGDRITGSVVRLEKSTLALQTEYAGEIKIEWPAVERVTTGEAVHVTTKEGQTVAGTLSVTGDAVVIHAPGIPARTLARAEVVAIRNEKEQAEFVKAQQPPPPPGLLDNWFGSLDLGLSAARGNADTSTFSVAVNAARATARDRATFYYTQLLGRESTTGVTITTANTIRTGLRYDRLLRKRLFAFGFGDFEFDELQQLDLRSVFGGGLGAALKRTDRTRLDLFAGASFNNEVFSTGVTRQSGEGLAGQEFSYKLGGKLTFNERLIFYPNLTDPGEYRITFDSSLGGKINTWLGWHLTLSDRYNSNPAAGSKNNDLLLTTGLRLTFGSEREFSIDSRAPDLIRRR